MGLIRALRTDATAPPKSASSPKFVKVNTRERNEMQKSKQFHFARTSHSCEKSTHRLFRYDLAPEDEVTCLVNNDHSKIKRKSV